MAAQINTTIPNKFHNLSPAMLADLIGSLDRQAKAATSELEAAKTAFKDRGLLIAEGEGFSVMVQKSIRATLDNAAVKSELGQSWYDDHCKLAEISTIRIAAAKPVAVAA